MGFSGRFVLPLFFLGCLIAVPSFADSGTDFSNTGGTLTGTTAGLSLSGINPYGSYRIQRWQHGRRRSGHGLIHDWLFD